MVALYPKIVFYPDRPWLAGEPIHCGDVIEVHFPDVGWVRGHVELARPDTWVLVDASGRGRRLEDGQFARWPQGGERDDDARRATVYPPR